MIKFSHTLRFVRNPVCLIPLTSNGMSYSNEINLTHMGSTSKKRRNQFQYGTGHSVLLHALLMMLRLKLHVDYDNNSLPRQYRTGKAARLSEILVKIVLNPKINQKRQITCHISRPMNSRAVNVQSYFVHF